MVLESGVGFKNFISNPDFSMDMLIVMKFQDLFWDPPHPRYGEGLTIQDHFITYPRSFPAQTAKERGWERKKAGPAKKLFGSSYLTFKF